MEYGIAIIPPSHISSKISSIQNLFGNNGIEPHITVKAQGGLSPDLNWLKEIRKIALGFQSFKVTLSQAETFGNDVVYISVVSPELIKLHKEIITNLSLPTHITEQYYEGDQFTPHLTLGMVRTGFDCNDFPEMKNMADKFAKDGVSFTADFLRVYQLDGSQVTVLEDIKLA